MQDERVNRISNESATLLAGCKGFWPLNRAIGLSSGLAALLRGRAGTPVLTVVNEDGSTREGPD